MQYSNTDQFPSMRVHMPVVNYNGLICPPGSAGGYVSQVKRLELYNFPVRTRLDWNEKHVVLPPARSSG